MNFEDEAILADTEDAIEGLAEYVNGWDSAVLALGNMAGSLYSNNGGEYASGFNAACDAAGVDVVESA